MGLADRVYRFVARRMPMIGTSVAFRAMGWIWILVGGAHLLLDLPS
ncbi:hypothetical protein ACFP51_21755 [Streptomyces pratens]|uniref:Uncharacterized protein n=1 Tax=Streptomyces pratens TaxID=887456 RepID=A0ABW1LY04_9ACTN